MDSPVVSVCIVTYNHESFIVKTIEGVLMQKCSFSFELVIGEDCSTDRTALIIKDYEKKYSKVIKARYNNPNMGAQPNGIKTIEECTGKYIALCDGDDYWIDPYKLQKQVDFLEANSDYSLCFHDAIILYEDKSQQPSYFCSRDQKETSTVEDLIEKWFIPTASMVFRKESLTPLPDWFAEIYNGDYAMQLLLASKGKIRYLNEVMSVYKRQSGPGSLLGNPVYNRLYVLKKKEKLFRFFLSDHTKYEINIQKKIDKLTKDQFYERIRMKFPFLRKGITLFRIMINLTNN